MMILDLNNVMYATLLSSIGKHTNIAIETALVRHMVLNTIRAINVKFKQQYGQLIIAADSREYWRRQFFPYYKASRKKQRDKSELDWPAIFQAVNTIKHELREWFPYKYIEVVGAEADDVIGTLCSVIDEPVLIISADKDYKQLHSDKVKQYDPVNKTFVQSSDCHSFLFEHIIKGDVGDGIPNIASPDNCFVLGERQRKVSKKLFDQLKGIDGRKDDPLFRNYIRNKTLIDLTMIPDGLKQQIIEQYNSCQPSTKTDLIAYFSNHRLKSLMEQLNDF